MILLHMTQGSDIVNTEPVADGVPRDPHHRPICAWVQPSVFPNGGQQRASAFRATLPLLFIQPEVPACPAPLPPLAGKSTRLRASLVARSSRNANAHESPVRRSSPTRRREITGDCRRSRVRGNIGVLWGEGWLRPEVNVCLQINLPQCGKSLASQIWR